MHETLLVGLWRILYNTTDKSSFFLSLLSNMSPGLVFRLILGVVFIRGIPLMSVSRSGLSLTSVPVGVPCVPASISFFDNPPRLRIGVFNYICGNRAAGTCIGSGCLHYIRTEHPVDTFRRPLGGSGVDHNFAGTWDIPLCCKTVISVVFVFELIFV